MGSAFVSRLCRLTAFAALSLSVAACSTDALSPSARIDDTASVGAIARSPRSEAIVPDAEVNPYPAATPVTTAVEMSVPTMPAQDMPQPSAATPLTIPDGGVSMDAMLGVGPQASVGQQPVMGQPSVTGLAEEQSRAIGSFETNPSQILQPPATEPSAQATIDDPDLPPLTPAQIATEEARRTRLAAREKAEAEAQAERKRQTQDQVAFLPRTANPLEIDEEPRQSDAMPSNEIACRSELKKLGVQFRDVAAISNGRSCGIPYPIELTGLSGKIAVRPAVKLNCQVTAAFAKWVKNELAPSTRARYLTGLAVIQPMGGYSCRTMNSKRGNPMSEHARGNAIDIGKFVLKSGKEIDVRKKGFFAFREKGLLKAVRSDSCKYFSTVLGPGSDPQHWNHFHFDLRTHKSGYRHCD